VTTNGQVKLLWFVYIVLDCRGVTLSGNDGCCFLGTGVMVVASLRSLQRRSYCVGVLVVFCVTNVSQLSYTCVYMDVWMMSSVHETKGFVCFVVCLWLFL